ncbi:hypothetical protein ACFO26_02940 [Lactococcus nasutitermitis]|uniref:Phage protein n=1 Tax=Lactococcus nasutitermitis TaxID=1652957 RepID=A0ABV9JBI4_9LACT|nr:hypothetical protein [Lactococcus nasutitermitis]
MNIEKISDDEKQEVENLSFSQEEMYNMIKQQEDTEVKTIMIEALFIDNDLLAVTDNIDEADSSKALEIMLHTIVGYARLNTTIEDFIKKVISMWGTYDAMEGERD